MKLITSTTLKDLKGNEIKQKSDENSEAKPLTVGEVISNVLLICKEEKYKAWLLAKKMLEEEVELKSEDVTYIKKQLETSDYLPVAIGQIIEILEA